MSMQLESRAWHVAGHAYMAMAHRFDVARHSLDGFPESDRNDQDNSSQRLDPWTMIRLPELLHPPGTIQHSQFMERLCHIALAGPIRELLHEGQTCGIGAVQEHEYDWRQAWTAAGHLWSDETERIRYLKREIQRGEVFLGLTFSNEFTSPLVQRLLDQKQMTAEEVREVWNAMEAAKERRLSRCYRKPPKK